MSDISSNEHMLDMYLFETFQNIEQLENCILETEKTDNYTPDAVNEIFRIMHTIKGSSSMMLFNHISNLAHSMEDLFYFIREQKPEKIETGALSDLLLEGVDYIKIELEKIKVHDYEESSCSELIDRIKEFLSCLKNTDKSDSSMESSVVKEKMQYYIVPETLGKSEYHNSYKAVVYFEPGCEMENIRAYTIIHNLKQETNEVYYLPADITDNENCVEEIREKGFTIFFKINKNYNEMCNFFEQTIFLHKLELKLLEDEKEFRNFQELNTQLQGANVIKKPEVKKSNVSQRKEKDTTASSTVQNIISVNVTKLDLLLDLVGEMVISEALVTQNPDLADLELENFHKAARQHHKIISEIQDLVMAIRMVPLASTFQKMHRIVRDMNKKLQKETQLILIGEDTEVDKNIIEHISDPMMHLVRNAIDHGIESSEDREANGKDRAGKVTIEAKNSGSDVIIQIKDDGKGLDKDKILKKAYENGLINDFNAELTDQEIYQMIFLPGFSTKEDVSEFSGRGVGMDVVTKNIEVIGGAVSVDSTQGKGTNVTLKLPLTLAIIEGMNIRVGNSRYTIPITTIRESFRPGPGDVFTDPDGNELIVVRGKCYHIKRLHQVYQVDTDIVDFKDGVLIMVEQDDNACCLFADELLGQQEVVVKALPDFIKNVKNIHGITGCTLLGDGSISLILDIAGFIG